MTDSRRNVRHCSHLRDILWRWQGPADRCSSFLDFACGRKDEMKIQRTCGVQWFLPTGTLHDKSVQHNTQMQHSC